MVTHGYTTGDVCNLLGLTAPQIRSYVRAGVLAPERGPRGEYRFGFQDLVVLRSAAALLRADVAPRRVLAALRRLKAQLPAGRSLTEIRIRAEGDELVVSDGGAPWNPQSGQLHLDFSIAEFAAEVAPLARRESERAHQGAELSALDWYRLGAELEAVTPVEARAAYERALALDPGLADAHVNLGRLRHEQGHPAEAADHYRAALRATGGNAVAAYNLGVALEDLGQADEAIAAYRRALEADPRLAEAHYNLARLCEKRGEATAALRHYRTYRDLAGSGSGTGSR